MNYSEYIVLDVETTGVDARVDDVIEFAAVRLDAKGEVIDQLDFLIGTQQPISSTVMALTGIRPEDLSGQPEISTVIDKIRDFVGTAPIVGHNIGFDVEFLNAKGAELKNPVLDTLELAYTILPAQSYYSLEFLSHRFGFAHQPAHRAMADVLATTDLFRYLVGQVADLQATTRKQIISLVPADKWTWGWLVNEPPTFSRLTTHQIDEGESDQLAAEVKRGKAWAEEVLQAATDPINLVETHFAIAGDALALACAVVSAPAIVIVPDRLLYRINWAKLSQTVGAKVVPRYPSSLQYRTDAEVDLANSQESLSALEAQLITKVVIWRIEWGMDYSQLYLSREEQYQWEQKLAPVTPLDEPTDAVVVAAAGNLMDIGSFQNRVVVTARPLMMEDAAFADQSRIFSVNYFTAAISSRRDFVHQYVRGSDVKLADSLFKTLNHLSGSFQTITQSLVEIYTAHPPTSVYERNIELASEWLPASLSEALREAAGHVQKYLEGISGVSAPAALSQIERTRKLLVDLQLVAELSATHRYFLFADANRFFLDIVPTQFDPQPIRRLIGTAGRFIATGSSLSAGDQFSYLRGLFGDSHTQTLGLEPRTELLVAEDMPSGTDYYAALQRFASQVLSQPGRTVLLANSAYEARQLFEDVFTGGTTTGTVIESYDTVGNVSLVPALVAQHKKFFLIGHYAWFDRLSPYANAFDRLLLGRLPFEAVSRPQAKVLADADEGFNTYTLPRGIMRLKEVLHQAKLTGRPIAFLDSRILSRDYGRQVTAALLDFTIVPQGSDRIIE